jgi:hypothetical protein
LSRKFAARIRFVSPAEGGFSRPPLPGVRPQLRVGDVYTSCVVQSKSDQPFEFGQEHEVTLEILFWDEYGRLFTRETSVQLFDGNRLVAQGEFVDRMPPET